LPAGRDKMSQWTSKPYHYHSNKIGWYDQVTWDLVKLIPPTPRCLIDFACGTGRVSKKYLEYRPNIEQSLKLYLIDQSQEMLTQSADVAEKNVDVNYLCDDESLSNFPQSDYSRVNAIICGSAFHLIRDANLALAGHQLLKYAVPILDSSGYIVANIPDQAWLFDDGWKSAVYEESCKLWGPSSGRETLPLLSPSLVKSWAHQYGFLVEISTKSYDFWWSDFINFYSIPEIGAHRIPIQYKDNPIKYFDTVLPQFERIEFKHIFLVFSKQKSCL